MSSSKNRKKVVRIESILDETKICFSYILSPSKKKKQQQQQQMQHYNNYDYNHNYSTMKMQQPADYGNNGEYKQKEDEYEDVDARAEQYIKKKHQKFELSRLKMDVSAF